MKSKFRMYLNLIQEAIARSTLDSTDTKDVKGLKIPAEKVNDFLKAINVNILKTDSDAMEEIINKIIEISRRFGKKITKSNITSVGIHADIMNIIQDRFDNLEKEYFKDYIDKEKIKETKREIGKAALSKINSSDRTEGLRKDLKRTAAERTELLKQFKLNKMSFKQLENKKTETEADIATLTQKIENFNALEYGLGAEEGLAELKNDLRNLKANLDNIKSEMAGKKENLEKQESTLTKKKQELANVKKVRSDYFQSESQQQFKVELAKVLTVLNKKYYLINSNYKRDMQRLNRQYAFSVKENKAKQSREKAINNKYKLTKKEKIENLIDLVEEIITVINTKANAINEKAKLNKKPEVVSATNINIVEKELQEYFLGDKIEDIKGNLPSKSNPPRYVPERNDSNSDFNDEYIEDFGVFRKKFDSESNLLKIGTTERNLGDILYSNLPADINQTIVQLLKGKIKN